MTGDDVQAERVTRVYGVEMLRAVAATAVVAHHALRKSDTVAGAFSPDWLTLSMSAGVDIFFIVSGFIMVFVTFRPGRPVIAPGAFLWRRFVRIGPVYWFWCLVLLGLLATGIFKARGLTSGDVLASLALLPSRAPLFAVAWTLTYEFYFYLVFAATLPFASRRVSAGVTTAVIVALLIGSGLLPPGPARHFFHASIVLEFCLGMGLACLFATSDGERWAPRPALVAVAVAAMLAAPLVVPHASTAYLDEPFRAIVWGVPATLVVAAFLPLAAPVHRAGRALVAVGDASYSIYITHSFVIVAYAKALQHPAVARLPQVAIVPVVVTVAVVVGLAAHFLVERPLLAAVRALTGRKGPAPVPA